MSSEASDKSLWLAYCKAIQYIVQATPSESSAIFFATQAQKGPLASPFIPPEYTNNGLYDIGDNLLAADSLFYVPSFQNSYIRSLKNYLDWVDLGGHNSAAVITRVAITTRDLDSAILRKTTELKNAMAEFRQESEAGITGELAFAQWFPTNCPALVNAMMQVDAAAAANISALNDMQGPHASQWNQDINKINGAMISHGPIPGLSMPASGAAPATAQDILDAINRGKPVPPPKAVKYVPEYTSPEYTETVKDWINDPSSGRPGKNSITIDIHGGNEVDESDFGQVSVGGGLAFDYIPWLSFGVGGSSDHEEKLDKTKYNERDVDINLNFDEIRSVTIAPGAWNIGDPKSSYPNLKPGAPADKKILVAPTKLVVIKNLGYIIKFKSNLKSTFDKKVKDTKQGGGYVRIFGIPIKIGGDYKKSTENTSHVGTWDETNGELVVVPTDDAAFATVVAIIGNKIKTT